MNDIYESIRHAVTKGFFNQKKDGWCGPAALSYAMAQRGIVVPQGKLVKETKTTMGRGVDPGKLKQILSQYGFKANIIRGGNSDQKLNQIERALKQKKSVIVDYLENGEKDGGHYAVVKEAKKKFIRLWNPSSGSEETVKRKDFMENWKDTTIKGNDFSNLAIIFS